ncbi:BPSL0761 family protein [Burkholderia multivorans]|uniref:BPSL0761 family protein n=2 Tax=Burkholderia multivorans TaxID=87883 RepID=UPI0030C80897
MPIWTLASVTAEPELVLSQWRILETAEATRHFVGADARDSTGRVSSAVVTFDRLTLRGQTQSGRVYQLIGQPGWAMRNMSGKRTTAYERTKSVIETRTFLQMLASADDLASRRDVQSVAVRLLRHYPLNVDLDVSAAALPGVWVALGSRISGLNGRDHNR